MKPMIGIKTRQVIYKCLEISDDEFHDENLEKHMNIVECEQLGQRFCRHLWDHV
jgi:hypothetical protein